MESQSAVSHHTQFWEVGGISPRESLNLSLYRRDICIELRVMIHNYFMKAFETNEELHDIIEHWCISTGRHRVMCLYGHISFWETSLITDMSYLFNLWSVL